MKILFKLIFWHFKLRLISLHPENVNFHEFSFISQFSFPIFFEWIDFSAFARKSRFEKLIFIVKRKILALHAIAQQIQPMSDATRSKYQKKLNEKYSQLTASDHDTQPGILLMYLWPNWFPFAMMVLTVLVRPLTSFLHNTLSYSSYSQYLHNATPPICFMRWK